MRSRFVSVTLLSLLAGLSCQRQDNSAAPGPDATQPAPMTSAPSVEPMVAPPTLPKGSLDVRPALRVDDLRKALQTERKFDEAPLQGIRPSARYGYARLRPRGQDDNYGIAIQVWRTLTEAAAEQRLTRFLRTQPAARRTAEIGASSVRAQRKRILHLSWSVPGTWEVVTLTCDDRLCNPATLLSMAHRVDIRLADLHPPQPVDKPPRP